MAKKKASKKPAVTVDPDPARITRLPKWAQIEIIALMQLVVKREQTIEILKNAHAVLQDREWFTLPGPLPNEHLTHLWFLRADRPFPVCSLGRGDVLLIGRATKS